MSLPLKKRPVRECTKKSKRTYEAYLSDESSGCESDDSGSVMVYRRPSKRSTNRTSLYRAQTKREGMPLDGSKASMEAFWRSKGVTVSSQIDKLTSMAGYRKLYGDLDRIDCKLEQLKRMLPGADVVKIISNAPNLLVYDIETSIPPKLEQLQRILPGIDVVKIVTSSPHLLTFDIENNIAPKMQQLWELLPGANVVKIVSAAPNLLSYDIQTSLAAKIKQLWHLLPGADIVKLVSYAPTLLYHDTEQSIAPKLVQLRTLLPGCDVVKMVCSAPPLLCSDIEGSVARKLMWMKEMVDGEEEEVNNKIESNPRLLTCGYGVVFGRMEYVSKLKGNYVPIGQLRSILLAPIKKFQEEYPGYKNYLAEQLVASKWKEQNLGDLLEVAVKKLEGDYGNCLRAVVNKL